MAITDYVLHLVHWEHILILLLFIYVLTAHPYVILAIRLENALHVFLAHSLAHTTTYAIIHVLVHTMVILAHMYVQHAIRHA